MPPSQLKRLKKSLREQGITGPRQSKKQEKTGRDGTNRSERSAALQQIRDSFNPFELRAVSARPAKFETANGPAKRYRDVLYRPGVTKSAGEEMRRRQLLPEIQRRNKVGGLLDRRIGETDPDMTPEEKAVQRFTREKSRKKDTSLFDLELSDEDDTRVGLTHLGRSVDEIENEQLADAAAQRQEREGGEIMLRKRRRSNETEDLIDIAAQEEPDPKKTRKEVMEEVIAKSKLYKYERQKAKEDDDDLREGLDRGTGEVLALLRGHKPPLPPVTMEGRVANGSAPVTNPDRQKLLDGMDREEADKQYEVRLRQLARDARAKPSERTRTEEDRAAEEVQRLRELEQRRIERMKGGTVSDDEEYTREAEQADAGVDPFGDHEMPDDAGDFGLTSSIPAPENEKIQEALEDEDEFALDDDLVDNASDLVLSEDTVASEQTEDENAAPDAQADEEEEFVKGILNDTDVSKALKESAIGMDVRGLAFKYPCPRSHTELLEVIKDVQPEQLPTVVQRIRALYHPSLSTSNNDAIADFSTALVDHIAHMGDQKQSLVVIEQLIRHLHSLSRTYPTQIAKALRRHLQRFHQRGQPMAGDMVILTAIGSIYPTSDHFHQVVTPAMTLLAKWLGLNNPASDNNGATGAFLVSQCVNYQKLSKRYVPEAMRFSLKALVMKPTFPDEQLRPHLDNLVAMADLWKDKTAFTEIFNPTIPVLTDVGAKKDHQHIQILLQQARLRRRPLELHHHRPQPIRTSIPKFEEGFNPDKHYDPDKERSDARKLQKEYKRERKGALRELRKDANFIAREQLKEKKAKDEQYERKQKRLVAEIQGEEGHAAKEYEREKRLRKRQR